MHEQQQLDSECLEIDDGDTPVINDDLIGRYISISWNREGHGVCFDVGQVKKMNGPIATVMYLDKSHEVTDLTEKNNFKNKTTVPNSERKWRMLTPTK